MDRLKPILRGLRDIVERCIRQWSMGFSLQLVNNMCRVELLSFFSISFVVFLLVLFACATILCGEPKVEYNNVKSV